MERIVTDLMPKDFLQVMVDGKIMVAQLHH